MSALNHYKTWVFDCDGVLLNSNRVKTEAFFEAAKPYGVDKAQALVNYHVQNGGISRYVKFENFLTEIVGRETIDTDELDDLLSRYARSVKQGLRDCEAASGLEQLRQLTRGARWLVVSGGDQAELREVFRDRGLAAYFDGGIFGSPDNKDEILNRELVSGTIGLPAVFVGDSRYDIEAASRAGLDFVFLSQWSESDYDFANASLRLESIKSIVEHLS
ncbi:haloacid dehalogenase-like family hydrolase [Marinobacter lipolyticus SM19]|uniref:phosphoglycolate phosphatase n=1 Tax=Marinobacter lipolyticus SM19 TaxID=1318628 RepID=R8AWD1_9GAMM|nr:HAD family hydrolase [Marinobacter lipolyticus]EON90644.1 haloacid dehalogenase-like family hydrolase [Marinobacter lipolyticus SM19]